MTNNKKTVHVVMGLAGSGKTTLAKELIQKNYRLPNSKYSHIISFADSLRRTSFLIANNIPDNYENFKKRLLFLDSFPDNISRFAKMLNPNWINGRELLQIVGDNIARLFGKDVWVNHAIKEIDSALNNGLDVFIDDCRKKHELIAVREYCIKNKCNMILHFTDYRSDKYNDKDNHVSEQMALWIRDSLGIKHRHEEELPLENYKSGTTINDITNKDFDLYNKILYGFKEQV